jgi:hypothetical protein
MSVRKRVLVIVMVSALLLAVGMGPSVGYPARALPEPSAEPAGTTIPYAGRLSLALPRDAARSDEAGKSVADGAYDFTFTLYDAVSGGNPLWSEVQQGVVVSNGEFLAFLGSVEPIPPAALDGRPDRWLAVAVRGPGEAAFTALAPRQRLDSAVPLSPATSAACPHDHLGEVWVGDPLFGLYLQNNNSSLLSVGMFGVGQTGVKGSSYNRYGVHGESTLGNGVYAESGGSGHTWAALRANSTAAGCGVAAYLTNNSGCPTLEIDKHGAGGAAIDLQLFDPGNYDPAMFIKAYDENVILQFLVSTNGIVAANGYIDWRADMAEMLPAAEGLEPGDVLAIGPDGNLIRSTEAYQTSVAGVYSTDPGFMFGHPLEGQTAGTIPLAMAGVVPVKVSAENGPIQPGDLLVSSSTPGHAMKADRNPPQGAVIGKALEAWDEGAGTIQMLAMLQ